MKIIVGIATAGRREVLSETLLHLSRQDRQADAILVCPSSPQDVDLDFVSTLASDDHPGHGQQGLLCAAQRHPRPHGDRRYHRVFRR